MSTEEILALLEEAMDLDEGDLTVETVLADLEEWDSLSRLSLVAAAKKKMNMTLTTDIIRGFVTVKDICDCLK